MPGHLNGDDDAIKGDVMKTSGWLVAAMCALGCQSTQMKVEAVTNRAKFDMQCDSVAVSEIGDNTFGARGCGRQATYVTEGNCGAALPARCTAVLNSRTEPTGK